MDGKTKDKANRIINIKVIVPAIHGWRSNWLDSVVMRTRNVVIRKGGNVLNGRLGRRRRAMGAGRLIVGRVLADQCLVQ